jgi:hypothetical protein
MTLAGWGRNTAGRSLFGMEAMFQYWFTPAEAEVEYHTLKSEAGGYSRGSLSDILIDWGPSEKLSIRTVPRSGISITGSDTTTSRLQTLLKTPRAAQSAA